MRVGRRNGNALSFRQKFSFAVCPSARGVTSARAFTILLRGRDNRTTLRNSGGAADTSLSQMMVLS